MLNFKSDMKEALHTRCLEMLKERIVRLEGEVNQLNQSQSSETKSSMGDKYETAREMINLEKSKLSSQLSESTKMLSFLSAINPTKGFSSAEAGALVVAETGNYYLSIAFGKIDLEDSTYFVISPVSPGLKRSE